MKIISSWDDGRREDIRLAKLLEKYEIPGIFFIPSGITDLSNDEIKKLSERFEIGGHTITHPFDMKLLTYQQQKDEILGDKETLEGIIGKEIEWFCYPKGKYNNITIEVVKDAGYKYARTTKVFSIRQPIDNYRVESTVHVFNGRKEYRGKTWLQVALEQYLLAKENENSYYHIWGHSWEIERDDLWEELEYLFKKIYGDKNNRGNNNND